MSLELFGNGGHDSLNWICLFLIFLFIFFLGVVVGIVLYIYFNKKKINNILQEAKYYVAKKLAEMKKQKQEIFSESQKEIYFLKRDLALDFNEKQRIINDLENKINFKKELLNAKIEYLNFKEKEIKSKENKINMTTNDINKLKDEIKNIKNEIKIKLETIALLTEKEAYKIVMEKAKISVDKDITVYIKNQYEKIKNNFKNKAKILLALTMQKYAYDVTNEYNVNVVNIPDEKMKGHIIGKDGRNIKVLESLTGVDLIINDVPNVIVLSCFNPIRREIAKRTLEILISDGRIFPNRIEKVIGNITDELDNFIIEKGENASFITKIGEVTPELLFILGQLHFRTSYGQNVLQHSIEVAFLAGKLAAELGENEITARRAGLFHDIGKALDHDVDGNHVEIGVDIANKYGESKEVIDAIASHHEDKQPETVIAILVIIADILSAARPGVRKESVEQYIQRLKHLEQIANEISGVDKSYAIKAGREIRVIVKSDQVNDYDTFAIAKILKDKITKNINYKGVIKVTVIRELKVIESVKL